MRNVFRSIRSQLAETRRDVGSLKRCKLVSIPEGRDILGHVRCLQGFRLVLLTAPTKCCISLEKYISHLRRVFSKDALYLFGDIS